MFSAAMNQPAFDPDDAGGMGQWEEIISGISSIATPVLQYQIQVNAARDANAAAAAKTQQMQQTMLQAAQYQASLPVTAQITGSPYFLPALAGLGLLIVFLPMMRK